MHREKAILVPGYFDPVTGHVLHPAAAKGGRQSHAALSQRQSRLQAITSHDGYCGENLGSIGGHVEQTEAVESRLKTRYSGADRG